MTPIIKFLVFSLLIPLSDAHAGDLRGNGGDAFDETGSGQELKMFDYVEFGKTFRPEQLPEFKRIEEKLTDIDRIAPNFALALRETFRSALWSFVEPDLKDIKATGSTNLILAFRKVQAAIAVPEKMAVQINKGVWDHLPDESRAYLLLHEMLWIAERSPLLYQKINPRVELISLGTDSNSRPDYLTKNDFTAINIDDITTNSESIRRLTGYLMAPKSPFDDTESFVSFVKNNVGQVNQNTEFKNLTDAHTECYDVNTDQERNYAEIRASAWVKRCVDLQFFEFQTVPNRGWFSITPLMNEGHWIYPHMMYVDNIFYKHWDAAPVIQSTPLGYYADKDLSHARLHLLAAAEIRDNAFLKNTRQSFLISKSLSLGDIRDQTRFTCAFRFIDGDDTFYQVNLKSRTGKLSYGQKVAELQGLGADYPRRALTIQLPSDSDALGTADFEGIKHSAIALRIDTEGTIVGEFLAKSDKGVTPLTNSNVLDATGYLSCGVDSSPAPVEVNMDRHFTAKAKVGLFKFSHKDARDAALKQCNQYVFDLPAESKTRRENTVLACKCDLERDCSSNSSTTTCSAWLQWTQYYYGSPSRYK